MLAEERKRRLIKVVSSRGYISTQELCDELIASPATIRRDLIAVEQEGLVARTRGGAWKIDSFGIVQPFANRKTQYSLEKRQIGKAAAALVRDGDTIFLNGSTTVFEMAPYLIHKHIQVVTNSIHVAYALMNISSIQLVVTGGSAYPQSGFLLGPSSIESIRKINVGRAFMGTGGITPEGITNTNALVAEVDLAIINAAHQVNILADHSKIGHSALVRVCGWEKIHRLITDAKPSALAGIFREHNLDVIFVNDTK